jgi:TfoX/Sxy family transcriptional regulator of competence genes
MAVSDEFLDYVIDQLSVMSYYEIPADILEDAELLGKWAERAPFGFAQDKSNMARK